MRLLLLSISHHNAPLAVREAMAFDQARTDAILATLQHRYPTAEIALLATCNRTEVYIARPSHAPPTAQDLCEMLAQASGMTTEQITSVAIVREQEQAAMHLFRVCVGLDSMVLGEPQILGQVKRAYEAGAQAQSVGRILHRLFQGAIASAKLARNATGIDAGRTSVGSVAVDFARNIFDRFDDKSVLAIGAGEMIKAVLHSFKRIEPGRLWVVNRTYERGCNLAESLELAGPDHGARPWDDLERLVVECDIIISCTGSPDPIITKAWFAKLIKKRRNRPLFMIDIAIPRDIEPSVGSLSNVYLYNLDDLQQAVEATQADRQNEISGCEAILHEQVARCMGEIRHHDLGKIVKQLREVLSDIAEQEQDRTQRKFATLDQCPDNDRINEILGEHNHRLINKILHLPLSQLDKGDPDAPVGFYAAALRRLFALEDAPTHDETPPPPETPTPPADASAELPAKQAATHSHDVSA